jgi:4-amino-4-deoxy-L-arabinose transferase-like glycosyltransferase
MTVYPMRAARRVRAAVAEALRAAEARPRLTLLVLLGLGLLIRLPYLGSRGFPVDVHDFQAWALRLADVGPGSFYAPGYFADFFPGYLWWLWLAGSWARAFGIGVDTLGFLVLLKLPVIVADLVAGAVLYAWVRPRLGLLAAHAAAALYLANPAVIFVGVVWGQVDGLAAALAFAGTVALLRGRLLWALPLCVVAVITKPQVAVLAPVWLAILALPYFRRASEDALPRAPLREWLGGGLAALVTGVALLAPFRLGPVGAVRQLAGAAGVYPFTSVGALNLWSFPWAPMWQPDQAHAGPLTYQQVGLLLFGAALLLALAALLRRPTAGVAMTSCAMVLVAFYALPTRIHERYLVPAILFLAALALVRTRWLVLYGLVTGVLYLTFLRVYTNPLYQTGVPRPALLNNLLEPPGMWLISLGILAALGALLYALHVAPATLAPASPRPLPPPPEPRPTPASAVVAPSTAAREPRWSRREVLVLALLLLLVFSLRAFRLADPPAPVFDEVYHPRTAMEYLAFLRYGVRDEVYEWTHPPLAKELMAAGIALWGNHRVVHRWPLAVSGDLVVGDGWQHRLYWVGPNQGLTTVDARTGTVVERRPLRGTPTALALSPSRELLIAFADGRTQGRRPVAAPWNAKLEQPAQRLSADANGWWALGADGRRVYKATSGGDWQTAFDLPVAARHLVATPSGVWVGGGAGVTAFDGAGTLVQQFSSAPVYALVYNDTQVEGQTRVIAARRTGLDIYDSEHRSRARTIPIPALADSVTPVVVNGHAHLLHVSTTAGVQVVDLIGNSPFVRIKAPPGSLALDADSRRPDSRNQVYLWDAAGRQLSQIDGAHNAFGWRIVGVLFAALLALAVYLLTRSLLGSVLAARLATFLVAFDFMTFSQSRIGTPDIYVAALVVLAYWAVYRALHAAGRAQVAWFVAGGLFLGGAAASKWVGVYAGVALLAGVVVWVGVHPALRARVGRVAALTVLALVALPVAIYLASFLLYFQMGHSLANFFALQQQMYHYHATLAAPHPAGSPWWSWPLVLKPVWFYSHALETDQGPATAVIYDAGNLAVWWPLLPALVALAVVAWRRRVAAWALPVWAGAGQWLPWVRITRVAYLYHFFSVVPFGMVALAYWAERGLRARAWRRWTMVYLGAVALMFVLIYPWISAVPIRNQDLANYQWLTSWAYDFQFYPSSKAP